MSKYASYKILLKCHIIQQHKFKNKHALSISNQPSPRFFFSFITTYLELKLHPSETSNPPIKPYLLCYELFPNPAWVVLQ